MCTLVLPFCVITQTSHCAPPHRCTNHALRGLSISHDRRCKLWTTNLCGLWGKIFLGRRSPYEKQPYPKYIRKWLPTYHNPIWRFYLLSANRRGDFKEHNEAQAVLRSQRNLVGLAIVDLQSLIYELQYITFLSWVSRVLVSPSSSLSAARVHAPALVFFFVFCFLSWRGLYLEAAFSLRLNQCVCLTFARCLFCCSVTSVFKLFSYDVSDCGWRSQCQANNRHLLNALNVK